MKKYLYFALAVLYACSPALAQDDYPTETDLYVFWLRPTYRKAIRCRTDKSASATLTPSIA